MRYLDFLFVLLGFNAAHCAEITDAARAQAIAQINERIQVVRKAQRRKFIKSLIGAVASGASFGSLLWYFNKVAPAPLGPFGPRFFLGSELSLYLLTLGLYGTLLSSQLFTMQAAFDYYDYTAPFGSVDALDILYHQIKPQ